MRLRALLVIFTLQSLRCMGEQEFLSRPDIQFSELSDMMSTDISKVGEKALLSQPQNEESELLEIPADITYSNEEKPILIGVGSGQIKPRDEKIPPVNTLYDKNSMKTYSVYDGTGGTWYDTRYTEGNQAACGITGFWQKAQDGYDAWQKYKENDDSATLGFVLISCGWNNWDDQRFLYVGNAYDFSQHIQVMCKPGTYMYGMTTQSVPFRGDGYDDTAINGLNIMCSDKQGYYQHENWYSGWWGSWQYIYDYDSRMKVVGAQVKVDARFSGNDNQGLTGLKLVLAKFY
jgi:hypothetical protein